MISKNVIRVGGVITAIAALQLVATAMLGRTLPKADFGLYRIVLSIVDTAAVIGLLGLDIAIVRFFSTPGNAISEYDWRGFLARYLPVSCALATALGVTAAAFYKLPALLICAVAGITALSIIIFIGGALLRAQHKFIRAILFNRLHYPLYAFIIAALFFLRQISFIAAISGFTAALSITACVVIIVALKEIPFGSQPLPCNVLKNSLIYWGIGISLMVILQSGFFFIGKMLTLEDLALFSATAAIMRLFEFMHDAAYYVLAPALNTDTHISTRRVLVKMMSMSLVIALFYVLFSAQIINWLFAGRYNGGLFLVPFFIAIGIIRSVFAVAASIVGGRSSERSLLHMLYVLAAAVPVNMALMYSCIHRWQLTGAALAQIFIWCAITGSSFMILKIDAPARRRAIRSATA